MKKTEEREEEEGLRRMWKSVMKTLTFPLSQMESNCRVFCRKLCFKNITLLHWKYIVKVKNGTCCNYS